MAVITVSVFLAFCVMAQKDPPGPVGSHGPIGPPVPNCRGVSCPRPQCADPVKIRGKCCPSCSKSKCKFRGCVQYEPKNKVIWRPDPCTKCECRKGNELCGSYGCLAKPPGPSRECFGRHCSAATPVACDSCELKWIKLEYHTFFILTSTGLGFKRSFVKL